MEKFATGLISRLGTAGVMLGGRRQPSAPSSVSAMVSHDSTRSPGLKTRLLSYSGFTSFRHTIPPVAAFLLYVLLSRPEVILLSKLGATVWYPGTGLAFAFMLGINPRFFPLFVVADAASAVAVYHQPISAWSTVVGSVLEMGVYALCAQFLRRMAGVNWSLTRIREVSIYLLGALTAATVAAPIGAVCLLADHSIERNEFWHATLGWYFGDAISLFSVAPLLLIYVLPWLAKKQLLPGTNISDLSGETVAADSSLTPMHTLQMAGQAISFVAVFALMFKESVSTHLFYLAFVPVIWIAMYWGIGGAAIGLVGLNFGIVAVFRFVSFEPQVLWELGGLMLVVSGTCLMLGAAVTERKATADELHEHTVFLKSLIGNSPFGIVVQDRAQGIRLVNDAFLDLFRFNPFEVIGKKVKDLIVPHDLQDENRELFRLATAGRPVQRSVRRMRKDGQMVDVEAHVIPTVRSGKVVEHYIIYKDISDQIKAAAAEREHADAVRRWAGELEIRTLQVTLLNEMGGLLQSCETCNDAYAVVAQCAKELFAGSQYGALYILNADNDLFVLQAEWGSTNATQPAFPPDNCRALGSAEPHWIGQHEKSNCAHLDAAFGGDSLCIPLCSHSGTFGLLHIQLLSEVGSDDIEATHKFQESLKRLAVAAGRQIGLSVANLRLREALREQAVRDPLTGLYNRRFFLDALERELQRAKRNGKPLAILFLDVDHFKRFNDTFGHEAGDKVLRSVAEALRLSFRAEDVTCRYGGEEFALLLPEASVLNAAKRAEKLRTKVRELQLEHRGVALDSVTISIGIVGYPDQGEHAAELLDRADQYLYQAKANGRDCIYVAPNDSECS